VPWPSRLLPKPAKQLPGSTIDRFDGRTDDEKMAQRPGGSGVGAAGAHLHQVLQDCNLLEYEPLLLEEGADDVSQLKELDEEEFRQLCIMVGMASKPFHVKRLQKALRRPSSQIYSSKLTGASSVTPTTTSLQLQTSHPPGNHGAMITGVRTSALVSGGVPQSLSKLPPKVQAPASTAALPSLLGVTSSARQGECYQQLPTQHFEAAGANNNRVSIATHSVTPEKVHLASEVAATTSSSVTPSVSYQLEQQASSGFNSPPPLSSKQLFLPPYLQPDSDVRDLSSLVDELLTPIQAELGPCPFKPGDWDERRTELVRRYSAIYGQGNSKRKNEELSLHEQNINMAAFQLCLRDPTLLVRRDELLVLSRKAIKDGGYTFQHGLSKAKLPSSEHLLPVPSIGVVRKQPLEAIPALDEGSSGFSTGGLTGNLLPPPRNMSREKKLKRIEELEFLITKNKMKQSVKLAALEKARQTNDFSMSHHLQAEIESLGSTLANLQDQYSNMKYRLRRSDRYFEKKRKMEEMMDAEMIRTAQQLSSPAAEPAAKRVRPDFSSGEMSSDEGQGPVAYYTAPQADEPRPSTTNALPADYSTSSSSGLTANTTVSYSRSHFQVTPATVSPSSTPHTSPSPNDTELTYINTRPTSMAQVLTQQEETESNSRGMEGGRERASDTTPTSELDRQSGEILTVHGKDLLANINKLATKAAANLRSMPHF
jgi:hypothetical protein